MRRLIPFLLLCGAAIAQTLPNAVPMPAPEIQYLNSAGQPLAGAFLCSFAAGTSTPLATYTDSTAGTPNTNPIVLDSNGRASVWVGPSLYKFILYVGGNGACPGTGAVQWSQDNVSDTTLYFVNWVKTAGTATLITYNEGGTGAVTRTVSSRLQEKVSVKDFGATGNGVTDDTAAIQLAATNCPGCLLVVPAGTYIISSTLTLPANTGILGADEYATVLKFTSTTSNVNGLVVQANASIAYLTILGPGGGSHISGTCGLCGALGQDVVSVDHVKVTAWGEHVLNTGGSNRWTITNSEITGGYYDGVFLSGNSSHHLVQGNWIHANGSNGIDLNSSDNRIIGNTVEANGSNLSGVDCWGVLLSAVNDPHTGVTYSSGNVISGNWIYGNKCAQVIVRAEVGNSMDNVIAGNYVDSTGAGTTGDGIVIDTSVGPTCANESNNIIANNVVNGATRHGILQGGGTYCTAANTLITGNQVIGASGYGIAITAGTGATVSNNTSKGSGTADLYNTQTDSVLNCNTTSSYQCGLVAQGIAWDPTTKRAGINPATPSTPRSFLEVNSTGNTDIGLYSSEANAKNHLVFIDQFGNLNFEDVSDAVTELTMNAAGATFSVPLTVPAGSTGNVLRLISNSVLPGTCTAGDIFRDTSVTPKRLWYCSDTNVWVTFAAMVATNGVASPGHATCWKTSFQIGYCSTQPDASGNCTCN